MPTVAPIEGTESQPSNATRSLGITMSNIVDELSSLNQEAKARVLAAAAILLDVDQRVIEALGGS